MSDEQRTGGRGDGVGEWTVVTRESVTKEPASVQVVRRFERWRDVRKAMRALDWLGIGYVLDGTRADVYVLTITVYEESV
jgi:SH3-like domain-containing protein